MGNIFCNACIDLLYTIQTEAHRTNPSDELQRIHNITSKPYLILPKTKILFPQDIPQLASTQRSWSQSPYQEISWDYMLPSGNLLNTIKEGQIVPVELRYGILNVLKELDTKKEHIDTINVLYLQPDELESRLAQGKEEFLDKIFRIDELKREFELEGILFQNHKAGLMRSMKMRIVAAHD